MAKTKRMNVLDAFQWAVDHVNWKIETAVGFSCKFCESGDYASRLNDPIKHERDCPYQLALQALEQINQD